MKRFMTVAIAIFFTMIILVGCSPGDTITGWFSKQSMGVITYGDAAGVQSELDKYKGDLKSSQTHQIKMADNTMILKSSTAEALIKQELLRKVVKSDKTEPLATMPSVTEDAGILFAKENVTPLTIGGKEVTAKYEGNVVIGNGRTYAKNFLILNDASWEQASGEEKMMGVLHFDSKNPKHEIANFSTESVQLVDIK